MAAVNRPKTSNGYGEKIQVTVVTVDKTKNRVECATRDGAMIFVAVWETGTVFRWPEVGEKWTVRRDMGVWRLDQIVQTELGEIESESVPKTLEELPEGDTRIIGETVHTGGINSADIESSGQITAANQSLFTHVNLSPTVTLSYTTYQEDEIVAENSEIISFDGILPQVGQRVLLTKQTEAVNGIYEVKQFDITGTEPYRSKWRLKRSRDSFRVNQTITVDGGLTQKNIQIPIKSTTVDPVSGETTAVGFEGWRNPVFSGSNANYETNGTFDEVKYRKLSNGMVVIKGLIKSGAFAPNAMFTLPSGYRPAKQLIFWQHAVYDNGSGLVVGLRVDVASNGQVLNTATGTVLEYLSLTITFFADGN